MVPTVTFRLFFVLAILAHVRRRIVHIAVAEHPDGGLDGTTASQHVFRQRAPGYLLHDRDSVFADVATTLA